MGTFNWRNAFSTLKRATMMEDPPMSPMTQAEARLRTRIITDAPSGLDALLSDGSANDSSGFPPGAIASPSDPHQNWTDRFQPPAPAVEVQRISGAESEVGAAAEMASGSGAEVEPDDGDSLSVFVGTWNLAGEPWPESLDLFLQPQNNYDIYSIGTEECGCSIAQSFLFPSKQKWVDALEAAPPGHQLIAQETLVATHIAVFVKKELLPLVSATESSSVATGLGNTLGNKGGVGVGFTVGSTSFLFINAHFAAHQNKIAERNRDFQRINQALELGRRNPNKDRALVAVRFDRVFWSGDLNYRINANRKMADMLLVQQMAEVLRSNDQLMLEMAAGRVFEGWAEGPLTFQPTYKLDFGSNTVYDTSSKARIPAWTDRVLWVPGPEIRLEIYTCVQEILTSDHLPVFATFKVGCDVDTFDAPLVQDDSQASRTCVVS